LWLECAASRRICSAQFEFNDIFTGINAPFESDESITADESPLPSTSDFHSISNGIAVRFLSLQRTFSIRALSGELFCKLHKRRWVSVENSAA
jgi:hypothetical protein